ncbi:helicase C-terminal domain-containing protein [Adlercreutzia sp. R7]|uniref:Helicase C-terminal domain-containing protein n=1 Tax=Adlercreutzia wanghongyangiae TaxID=3111451 RepID=A0ABU6IFG8_9ACTN|nr:helicase C-terminal domain-containing protein [Adlercreutzia sp. R7]
MARSTEPVQGQLRNFITDGTPADIVARYESLSARAQEGQFGAYDGNVVVLDTETTGFSLNHDELTQIAAARMVNGEIVDWYITFVNPGKPIPEDVAHLTDIHDDDVADAPSPSDALAGLVEFVGDAIVVAHNADFDRNFTTKHPAGYPLLENTWVDSLDLSRIALPRMKSHRLIDLVKAFGAPLSTHRADEDVAATCALFRILLAAVQAMPPMLVREIAGMADETQWPTVTVFKYFAETPAQDKPQPFSLRSLRRDRVGRIDMRAQLDADEIAADPDRSLVFPAADTVRDAFTAEGVIGSLYDDYEQREEQCAMAEAVRAAFTGSRNLVVEAGTGVGKSMAYLLPAALTARDNRITIGIATKTNALLDQLVYHELPALAEALGGNLTYASLKGFSHYPCLHRVERLVVDGPRMRMVGKEEKPQAPALAALLSFIEQTDYDDIDTLKIDYRVLPRWAITTTSHDCLRRKCPFFGTSCFVHGSRRRAEASNIVVTNHSLLFCDLAADGGLLPPIRYWVVDEAHGAENEARRAFSVELVEEDILSLAHRVASDESRRNVFLRAERTVVAPNNEEGATLFYGLTAKARSAGAKFSAEAIDFCAHIKDLLYYDANKRSKGYENVDLWLNDEIRSSTLFRTLANHGRAMAEAAEKLVTACQELVGYLDDAEGAAVVQREIAAIAIELKDIIRAVEIICVQCPDQYVYAATLSRKNDRPRNKLEALLLNVGYTLNETLYANTHSVVFASATLSVDGSFVGFEQALGLGQSEFSPADELMLASSYNFDEHMTVYVVNDMPEPNESSYLDVLQHLLVSAHRAQQGSMLTLFTNRREMERCFEEVQPALKQDDLRLVCQKWGVSVKGLRDDFLADEHLSLFALKSFWEGFDAPGATLKGVIIPKLPFAKPTDPLSCERAARDDAAWRRYVLPAAVLETKQAAGRLIRKADDRGVLILADKRLMTKGYGKTFLRSLPSQNIRFCSIDEITAELAATAG